MELYGHLFVNVILDYFLVDFTDLVIFTVGVEVFEFLVDLLLDWVKFWHKWLVFEGLHWDLRGLGLRFFYFSLDVHFCFFTNLLNSFYLSLLNWWTNS